MIRNCKIELENGLNLHGDVLSVNMEAEYPILEIQVYGSKEITGDYFKSRNRKRRKFRLFGRFWA